MKKFSRFQPYMLMLEPTCNLKFLSSLDYFPFQRFETITDVLICLILLLDYLLV
jgi:hypothetical protein